MLLAIMLSLGQAAEESMDEQFKLRGDRTHLPPAAVDLVDGKKTQKRGVLGLGYGAGQGAFGSYYGGFGGGFGYPYYSGFGGPRFPYYSGFGF